MGAQQFPGKQNENPFKEMNFFPKSKKMKHEFQVPSKKSAKDDLVTIPVLESSKKLNPIRTIAIPNEKTNDDPNLSNTSKVEGKFKGIFCFEKFNKMQSECFSLIYESDENSVITAPTGSGKTALFELAICRLYKENANSKDLIRGIYIAPMKALCQEKYEDWSKRLGEVGLSVMELTGDTEEIMFGELAKVHIILTTPEKWDTITRKWKDHKYLVQGIRLVMIDEVHLLNTERGATLEAIVARMRSIANLSGNRLRYLIIYINNRTIAQSATIPNIEDLCEWLSVKKETGLKKFGEEFRPVKLNKFVLGYPPAKNEYTFERALNFKLANVIKQYSSKRPTLVFCQTQKGTLAAANRLKEDIDSSYLIDSPQQREELNEAAKEVKEKSLQSKLKI